MKYNILNFIKTISDTVFVRVSAGEKFLIFGANRGENTYYSYFKNDLFKEYKNNLFKGLNKNSKNILSRAIKRINGVINKDETKFLVTISEGITLYKAKKAKQNSVRKINDGWAYNDLILPRNHFNNCIFFDKYFIEEFSNLNKIKSGDILDVGGFIGDSAILFEKYTSKNVHVFEPVNSNYIDLIKTIELNHSTRIIPHKFALGAENKTAFINVYEKSGVGSTLNEDRSLGQDNIREEIKIKTLDSVINELNIKPSLIKVDIEGAEEDFLRGAIKTIKEFKPALIISMYHSGKDFFKLKEIINSYGLGYKFKVRKASKPEIIDDTILLCEVL